MRKLLTLLFSLLPALGQNPPSTGCRIANSEYSGWHAIEMSNQWVTLSIVPELGGRLMQVTFEGHDYLFVNQQLKGQHFTPEASASQHRWFNYGGDKIWPMPEGNEDERHWPGAEGEPLDSGPFSLQILRQDTSCSVRLTGPPDPAIGQQYIRDITIGSDSPMIFFHAVMRNISGYPQVWSEQSVSQYDTADAQNRSQPNPDIWGFTPVHPHSAYLNSYHVRTGSASNPGYSMRDGLFGVQAGNAGGEVWLDSPGEWLAVVDYASGYGMVERFRYQDEAEYPGQATVIFYTTGQSRRGAENSARPAIHYMEAELNSPLVRLEPGESYAMDTQWFPVRVGHDFRTATYAGVISKPLSAERSGESITVSGQFGVFFAGSLELRFYARSGARLETRKLGEVTPIKPIDLTQAVPAPADTARISLHVIDRTGLDRGPLGEAAVAAPRPEGH